MKKATIKYSTGLILIFFCHILCAQIPRKMSYQAVVRDINNKLVSNETVNIRISILQGSIYNAAEYVELQSPTTNANGLISIVIGSKASNVEYGDLSAIKWDKDGPFYIKTEAKLENSDDYFVIASNELLSVPFALYAETANNVFSGNYDDLSNTPILWDSTWQSIKGKPELYDSNYNALKNRPNIKDSIDLYSFSGDYNDLCNKPAAWDSSYTSLKNKPDLSIYAKKDMEQGSITNMANPSLPQDAATKAYVDKIEAYAKNLENILIDSDLMLKDYDGNIYRAVTIGNQTWMAENLRVTHYADGTPIQKLNMSNAVGARSYYGWHNYDSVQYAVEFGAYYSFSTATRGGYTEEGVTSNNVQGVCPTNWHVPSKSEWEELYSYLSDEGYEQLLDALISSKEISFNAKATGYFISVFYDFQGINEYMWRTSTISSLDPFIAEPLNGGINFDIMKSRFDGIPVRCIKD